MRRLNSLIASCALAIAACGEAPVPPQSQPEWGLGESQGSEAAKPDFQPTLSAGDLIAPVVATLQPGNWVHGELGACSERDDWLVVRSGGELDHVFANHNSCGEPSLMRHAGRWSTDDQVVKLKWSNRSETVSRETTYWSTEHVLRLGAYVPTDAGWLRTDTSTRKIEGHRSASRVDVGLRLDDLELADGTACRMTATVTAEVDGASGSEIFAFDCHVTAVGDEFAIRADDIEEAPQWLAYLQQRGLWEQHPLRVANTIYGAFRPVVSTEDGQVLWHEGGDSMYRLTQDSPPTSMDELGH